MREGGNRLAKATDITDLVPDRGWKRPFDDPIPQPRGRQLVTLKDAGQYITGSSQADHDADEWQAAMEALLLDAEHDGPTMFARIAMMKARCTRACRTRLPRRAGNAPAFTGSFVDRNAGISARNGC
jgi:hypothetical protein